MHFFKMNVKDTNIFIIQFEFMFHHVQYGIKLYLFVIIINYNIFLIYFYNY